MRTSNRLITAATIAFALSGCAAQPRLAVLPVPLDTDDALTIPAAEATGTVTNVEILIDTPAALSAPEPLAEADIALLVREQTVAATVPPQPLGQFVETVFGQVLEVPYITGPGVAQRRDIVSMSGPRDMPARQFFALAEKALNQYGLVLGRQAGAVVIREAPGGANARAARQSTSLVVHAAALRTVSAEPAAGLLGELAATSGELKIAADQKDNGVLVSGSESEVANARQLLETIDRPEFAGMRVARIMPVLWNADALAGMLREVLGSEGYSVGSGGSGGTNLVHLSQPDCLLLFSDDARVFNRVLYWAGQLDSLDGAGGDRAGYFVYRVKHATANELGNLVARLAGGEGAGSEPAGRDERPLGVPVQRRALQSGGPVSSGGEQTATSGGGQVVIDTAGNRILFRGTRREFAQMLRLLRELDVAPKQVLVEITIAEVSLTDETRFGMEWFLDRQITGGSIQATTGGGLAREVAGLGITYARSFDQTSVTAALSAIATNQNLNIISTPKLMARSGGQAQILVGNDVPIITSQRATDVQSAGDTDVLQTVQYRQTGVILNIRPVVLDDDHIDLEIFQEVSSQQPNLTSAISSPVISNRSVTTRLSLRAGMTAVLGGMIQDSQTMGQRGVPLLKDIPLIGRAFRTDSASKHKTELLVLVTPRVIREDKTMQDLAANFGSAMNGLMQGRGQRTFTLVPWMPGAAMPPHSHYRPIRQTRTKEPWP
jgi:general secretion pathway protein D